ncbi:hypothetical protein B0H15DRAFT_770207, partial [Mycena belliarum]
IELAAKGKRCWVKDLITAASRLPFTCPELILVETTSVDDVQNYAKLVDKLMMEWLQAQIDSSDKLYLLRGRLEPQKDKAPTQIVSTMRHYLTMVRTQTHREALTSILLSTHQLAVEILRYANHDHPQVPREDRRCRFCKTEVETPEHAMITCTSLDALVELRHAFMGELFSKCPNLQHHLTEDSNTEFLKVLINSRPSIALVAKFSHDVLQLFYAVPVLRA